MKKHSSVEKLFKHINRDTEGRKKNYAEINDRIKLYYALDNSLISEERNIKKTKMTTQSSSLHYTKQHRRKIQTRGMKYVRDQSRHHRKVHAQN